MSINGYFDSGWNNQKIGYSSGSALRNHMNSAHDGKFDIHCRACCELRIKGFEVNSAEVARENKIQGKPSIARCVGKPLTGEGESSPRRSIKESL